jgi:hypothetical protein
LPQLDEGRERLADLGRGGAQSREKIRTGFGQGDAAGGALEQRQPSDPRLERPDRLADGGGRYPEFGRRGAKARMVGNGEKLGEPGEQIGACQKPAPWRSD